MGDTSTQFGGGLNFTFRVVRYDQLVDGHSGTGDLHGDSPAGCYAE